MTIVRFVLIVAIAAIPILIAAGALMIRQEWRRRDVAEEASRAATARITSGIGASRMATVTAQVGGAPVADVRAPVWETAEIDPADRAIWSPGRPGGPQMSLPPLRRPAPGQTSTEQLRVQVAGLRADLDRARLDNARLRSELELCAAPSPVARVIRDEGPIASTDIAERVGATTWEVDREAHAMTIPRDGKPGMVSTLWPPAADGIDASDLLAGAGPVGPMWVWTSHLADPEIPVEDLPFDWSGLRAMLDEMTIGSGR